MEYRERTYRLLGKDRDLISFSVRVEETDLLIKAKKNLSRKIRKIVIKYREDIKNYIRKRREFLTSLVPIEDDKNAPRIVRDMITWAHCAGVGPMAGVAGAIAYYTGLELSSYTDEFIIENGGDIAICTKRERLIYIYPGERSPFKGKLFLRILPRERIYGIATSSGKIGPSLSFGRTDSATVLSPSPILSDMVATKVGNMVKKPEDIPHAIEEGKRIKGVEGILITIGDKLGMWGNVELL